MAGLMAASSLRGCHMETSPLRLTSPYTTWWRTWCGPACCCRSLICSTCMLCASHRCSSGWVEDEHVHALHAGGLADAALRQGPGMQADTCRRTATRRLAASAHQLMRAWQSCVIAALDVPSLATQQYLPAMTRIARSAQLITLLFVLAANAFSPDATHARLCCCPALRSTSLAAKHSKSSTCRSSRHSTSSPATASPSPAAAAMQPAWQQQQCQLKAAGCCQAVRHSSAAQGRLMYI